MLQPMHKSFVWDHLQQRTQCKDRPVDASAQHAEGIFSQLCFTALGVSAIVQQRGMRASVGMQTALSQVAYAYLHHRCERTCIQGNIGYGC